MRRWGMAVLAGLIFWATDAAAISRWGKVDDTLSYDALSITGGRGYCTMSVKFVNNSPIRYDGVYIKVYAHDNFQKMLRSHIFFIPTLDAKGSATVSERINSCDKADPYSIEFKVTK